MKKWARENKQNIIFFTILGIIAGFYLSGVIAINTATSFSGTTKTLGDDFLEVEDLNVTHFYLNDVNITDRLGGEWGSTDLNTTGSVNTADLNFTSEFYYNDENLTDMFAYPNQAYSYIIWKESSTYYAKFGLNQTLFASHSSPSTLMTWMIGNKTNDQLYIGLAGGIFTFTDEVNYSGPGAIPIRAQDDSLTIEGIGIHPVVLQGAEGKHIFVFKDCASVILMNLQFDIADDNGKPAILCSDEGSNAKSIWHTNFHNLRFYGGENTPNLVYVRIQNAMRWTWTGNNRWDMEPTGAIGLLMENTHATVKCFDGDWDGYWQFRMANNSQTAIWFNGSTYNANLLRSDATIFFAGMDETFTHLTGLKLDTVWNSRFSNLGGEQIDHFVNVTDIQRVIIDYTTYIQVDDGGTVFVVDGATKGFRVMHIPTINIGAGDTITAISDSRAGVTASYYYDIYIGDAAGSYTITSHAATVFEDIRIATGLYSEYVEQGVILNGWDNVTIAHNLFKQPQTAFAWWDGEVEDTPLYMTWNATHGIVYMAAGVAGADRDIMAYFSVNRDVPP